MDSARLFIECEVNTWWRTVQWHAVRWLDGSIEWCAQSKQRTSARLSNTKAETVKKSVTYNLMSKVNSYWFTKITVVTSTDQVHGDVYSVNTWYSHVALLKSFCCGYKCCVQCQCLLLLVSALPMLLPTLASTWLIFLDSWRENTKIYLLTSSAIVASQSSMQSISRAFTKLSIASSARNSNSMYISAIKRVL